MPKEISNQYWLNSNGMLYRMLKTFLSALVHIQNILKVFWEFSGVPVEPFLSFGVTPCTYVTNRRFLWLHWTFPSYNGLSYPLKTLTSYPHSITQSTTLVPLYSFGILSGVVYRWCLPLRHMLTCDKTSLNTNNALTVKAIILYYLLKVWTLLHLLLPCHEHEAY